MHLLRTYPVCGDSGTRNAFYSAVRTCQQQRNTDEARDSGADLRTASGQTSTEPFPVHQQIRFDVRRYLDGSGQERIEKDVAGQRSGVQRQSEVDQPAGEPRIKIRLNQ